MSKAKAKKISHRKLHSVSHPKSLKSKSLATDDFVIAHDFDIGNALQVSYVNTLSLDMRSVGNQILVEAIKTEIEPFIASRQKPV